MIGALINAFVPIFAGLLVGYLAGRWKFVDNQNVRTLIIFVMSVALPCSLFSSVDRLSAPVLEQQVQVALVLAITYLVTFIVVYWWAVRRLHLTRSGSAVLALTVSFPNLAAVGFPLLGAMDGPASMVAVAAGLAIGAMTISPITLAILENSTDNKKTGTAGACVSQSVIKAFKPAVVWAPLLGIFVALLSINLPKPVSNTLHTLGNATTGSALFLTGLVVSAQAVKLDRAVLLSVLGKTILQPAFCLLFAMSIGLAPQQRDWVVLISAIPSGFFGIVFGKNFPNAVSPVASASLIGTYITGIFTMAGWMVVLNHLHPGAV
jgi:malonate transporter and related proteins